MKQFIFSCTRKHKCLQQFLAMCLALTLLMSFQGTSVMATESTGLVSLSVSGVSNFDFDPSETAYTLYIPQTYTNGAADTLAVPTVYAEGADVQIDYPASVADGEVITISVDDGVPTVYTLTLDVIGENLYTNGNFEESGIPIASTNRVTTTKLTEDIAGGNTNNYIRMSFAATLAQMSPTPTLLAGKTYLISRMIRKVDDTVIADRYTTGTNPDNNQAWNKYRIAYSFDNLPSGSTTSISYSGLSTTSNMLDNIKPEEEWKPLTGLVTPSGNWLDKEGFFLGSWSNSVSNVLAMDDCFLGELVVGRLEITESNGAALQTMTKPEEGSNTVSLGAKFYNQLGTTVGMDDMSVSRWELAEEYSGVSINDDGQLMFDRTAPSTIKVLAYSDVSSNSSQIGGAKGEVEINLVGVEELEPAELSDIEVGGFSIPGFTSQKSSYTMYIPYTYNALQQSIPENLTVNATPVHEGTTYTTSRSGNILTVTATALDGTEKNYNIAILSVGDNLYTNGGFELDGHSYKTQNNYGTAEKLTDNPGSGTYYLEVGFKSEWLTFEPKATLSAGKTYLSSRMVRKSANTIDDITIQSEDINIHLNNFEGKANVYFDGMELGNNGSNAFQIVPTNSWKRHYTLLKPKNDCEDPHIYRTYGWTTWNYMAIDECFLGELTVADINYLGETQMVIPASGEQSYPLSAQLSNQLGTELGLENETVTWEVGDSFSGVYVQDNNLIVTDEAREQTIRVRAIVEPSFGDGYQIAKCFDVVLNSESANAEIPRAIDVEASGVVGYNQVLTGSYTYLNTVNIAESGTTFAWLYADTEDGVKHIIPNETSQTLTLSSDSEYVDKYLFFQVTPSSVEGRVGAPAISNVLMRPVAPTAVNLSISGGGSVGSELTGNYQFYDKNGDEESGSTYRWLRSANPQGPYVAIEDELGEPYAERTYTVTTDDIDQYISFEVTPKSAVAPEDGQPIASTGVLVAAKPTVKNVTIHEVSDTVYRVSYDYEHPLDIAQGVCRVQWYTDGRAAGNEMSQTIPDNVETLSVAITPVALQAPYEGDIVTEELTISTNSHVVGSVSNSGGGGGGGIGIGRDSVAKPVPVPEITPEPEVVEPEKHWAADGIEFVLSRGIMQELEPGDFCNSRLVTRREFIYYVMKTLGFNESAYKHEFQDVTGEDYCAGFLQTAVDEGIISKDVNFNPERNVSREEITKILVLASELQAQVEPNLEKFADANSVSEWARGYVGAAVESGLLKGVSEIEFFPAGAVTREQTAVILKRLYDYKNGGVVS